MVGGVLFIAYIKTGAFYTYCAYNEFFYSEFIYFVDIYIYAFTPVNPKSYS